MNLSLLNTCSYSRLEKMQDTNSDLLLQRRVFLSQKEKILSYASINYYNLEKWINQESQRVQRGKVFEAFGSFTAGFKRIMILLLLLVSSFCFSTGNIYILLDRQIMKNHCCLCFTVTNTLLVAPQYV